MDISGFSKNIFWSYKDNADILIDRRVKLVISYGEISDFITLSNKISQHKIIEVLKTGK